MQLFAAAWDRSGVDDRVVAGAVLAAATAIPRLDRRTLEHARSSSGNLAFAVVSHSADCAAPRRYFAQRDHEVLLFDGLPVDRGGRFPSHDAIVLAERWDDLRGTLDGTFSILRINLTQDRVECLLDVLGTAMVFSHHRPSRWIVSNSVETIRRLGGLGSPDDLGVGSLLSLGWPMGGRSLLADADVLAGGRLHRFSPDGVVAEPILTSASVAPRNARSERLSPEDLASALVRSTAAATASVGPIRCTLTGGRDARVLLALTLAAGVDATYYTSGQPGDVDVDVARRLADRLGLQHEVLEPPAPPTGTEWYETISRFVGQTDGLASVGDIEDWLAHEGSLQRLGLKIWGPGGEIARSGRVGLMVPLVSNAIGLRASSSVQKRTLVRKLCTYGELIRPSAIEPTVAYLRGFVDDRRAEGWRTREVLDSFYAFERVQRWSAIGVRRAAAGTDVFSPFISKDFITYAYGLSPEQRFLERAHYQLLSILSPVLRDLPYDVPWPHRGRGAVSLWLARQALRRGNARLRRPAAALKPKLVPAHAAWFEAGVPVQLELAASLPSSPVWEFVDRKRYIAALSGSPASRLAITEGLCRALTVLLYFHGRSL